MADRRKPAARAKSSVKRRTADPARQKAASDKTRKTPWHKALTKGKDISRAPKS
jgi:hypothetical protein